MSKKVESTAFLCIQFGKKRWQTHTHTPAHNGLMNIVNNIASSFTGSPRPGGTIFVTIIEARHLARKDVLSKSDPYVVVVLKHKRGLNLFKPKQRTHWIPNNQNPVVGSLPSFLHLSFFLPFHT
jgi:hypothetical protein